VRFSPKQLRRLLSRFFEWEMFEGVQCVVVNKDSNGPLPGKEVCAVFDCAAQSIETRWFSSARVADRRVPRRDFGISLATSCRWFEGQSPALTSLDRWKIPCIALRIFHSRLLNDAGSGVLWPTGVL
jgi:hypothetical protein